MGVVEMGGGRMRASDKIDVSVGLSNIAYIGDPVEAGDPLAILHGQDAESTEAMAESLSAAFDISDEQASAPELIKKVVD